MLIADAASRGTWQINEFLPLIADALLDEIELLTAANPLLAAHVRGLTADEARCRALFDASPMIVTALVPLIGYERATELIKEFHERQPSPDGSILPAEWDTAAARSIRTFLEEKLGKKLIDEVFSAYRLTALGYRKDGYDTEGK